MAWFWTDDLARILIESGAPASSVAELTERPSAIAAADRAAALAIARRLVGLDAADTDAA